MIQYKALTQEEIDALPEGAKTEMVIGVSKKFLKESDYIAIKISEETTKIVVELAKKANIDCSVLENLIQEYTDELSLRAERRKAINDLEK